MSCPGPFDVPSQASSGRELGQQPSASRTIGAPYSYNLAGPRASIRSERQGTGGGQAGISFVSREYHEHDPHHAEHKKQPIWGFAAPLPRVKRPGMESRRTRTASHGQTWSNRPESHFQPPAPSGREAAPQVGVTPDRKEEGQEENARPGAQQPSDLLRRATTAGLSTYHPDEQDQISTLKPVESVTSRHSRQTQDLADEHISAQDQATPLSSAEVRSRPSHHSTPTEAYRRPPQDLISSGRTWSRLSEAEVEAARGRLQGLADTAEHEPGLHQTLPNINWEEFQPDDETERFSHVEKSQDPPYYNLWGKWRNPLRQPFAEFLGTLVFMTIGLCGSIVRTTAPGDYGNLLTAYLAWGLGVMIGIYIAGGVSGGHLNPALSLMLSVFRGFPWSLCWQYILAQILGALAASGTVYGLYKDAIEQYASSDVARVGPAFWTAPRQDLSKAAAFFTEFTATAIASGSVLALGDDSNSPPGAGMHAFIIGLLTSALCMAFSYNTGTALNPARDLGPRLVTWMAGFSSDVFTLFDWWWIWGPWVGTMTGALFGAFVYDLLIFLGGESPVNYPTQFELRDRTGCWRDRRMGRGKDVQDKIHQKIETIA
ncbi:hypothetical protein RBB50_011172 [Rhinocladiella similis]